MSAFLFLFRELLSAIKKKSGIYLLAVVLLIFCFLALVSSFFLVGSSGTKETALPAGQVTAYLSPMLSIDETQELYLEIRELEEVSRINYLFGQELSPKRAGGVFMIEPESPAAVSPLGAELEQLEGIVEVDSQTQAGPVTISPAWRIGLLIGLVITGFGSLWLARLGFNELLLSYARAIRMLRFSGTTENTIRLPIVALGGVCGFFGAVLLIFVVFLLYSTHSQAVLHIASGLADLGRVRTVSLLSLLLGLCLGGLTGALGASLTDSREFRPY